jgi:(p)ppGpp synthase/HD superfamily hydrolase
MKLDPLPLGAKFDEALAWASKHHRKQPRKGTSIPYVAHLLQVAGLVLEAGGDEELAVAALLHDAVEDAEPGDAPRVRREIGDRFDKRVLAIVEALTDGTMPKADWEARKRVYLEKLAAQRDADVLLVSSADKLHNVRAINRDLRQVGHALWERFSGEREGIVGYYAELTRVYEEAGGTEEAGRTPLLPEFRRAVAELQWLASLPDPMSAPDLPLDDAR